jgi:hypothetical protein
MLLPPKEPPPAEQRADGAPDYEEVLASLRKLRDGGVLTEQEFQQKVLALAERAGR